MTFLNSSLTLQIERASLLNGTTLDYELRMAALAVLDKLKIPTELEPFLAYAKKYWSENTSLSKETKAYGLRNTIIDPDLDTEEKEEFFQVYENLDAISFTDPIVRRIANVLGFVLSYSELSDSEVLSDGVDWLGIYVRGLDPKDGSLLDLSPKDGAQKKSLEVYYDKASAPTKLRRVRGGKRFTLAPDEEYISLDFNRIGATPLLPLEREEAYVLYEGLTAVVMNPMEINPKTGQEFARESSFFKAKVRVHERAEAKTTLLEAGYSHITSLELDPTMPVLNISGFEKTVVYPLKNIDVGGQLLLFVDVPGEATELHVVIARPPR